MSPVIDDTITVAGAPHLPGLVFRRFRGPADYAGLTAAILSLIHI